MNKADMTSRAAAGFIDLLIVLALSRLPDILGFLAASGYILFRDALPGGQSPGKKLVGLCVVKGDSAGEPVEFKESILRNITIALAYLLFLIPFFGWILGPAALIAESLVAIGDDKGMRVGDMLARTQVIAAAPAGPRSTPAEEGPEATEGEEREDRREG